jgi:hypothetical protein
MYNMAKPSTVLVTALSLVLSSLAHVTNKVSQNAMVSFCVSRKCGLYRIGLDDAPHAHKYMHAAFDFHVYCTIYFYSPKNMKTYVASVAPASPAVNKLAMPSLIKLVMLELF